MIIRATDAYGFEAPTKWERVPTRGNLIAGGQWTGNINAATRGPDYRMLVTRNLFDGLQAQDGNRIRR
jgi:hypothetical protein